MHELGHWTQQTKRTDGYTNGSFNKICSCGGKHPVTTFMDFYNLVNVDQREALRQAIEDARELHRPFAIDLDLDDGAADGCHSRWQRQRRQWLGAELRPGGDYFPHRLVEQKRLRYQNKQAIALTIGTNQNQLFGNNEPDHRQSICKIAGAALTATATASLPGIWLSCPRLLALDLHDGTLLNANSTLPEAHAEAVAWAKSAGIEGGLCHRSPAAHNTRWVWERLSLNTPVVYLTGIQFDSGEEPLACEALQEAEVRRHFPLAKQVVPSASAG